ncbi:hypothetical protein KVR01_004001 [Diaporthe batatas]|uniref:uncharacterized protein n=1 Tax=Diaporthe batatas TaxID=748121 RepID=UPI001D051155|nr:uncharacterized protein KVR01_004001 [Diaporthe batatas]KAG8168312.1 hypothetical protein KVR01_004001 [Diaporthe batatas]
MADENYDFDVYEAADAQAQDGGQEHQQDGSEDYGENTPMNGAPELSDTGNEAHNGDGSHNGNDEQNNDQAASGSSAPHHGVKRKSEPDDRPVDPGATAALLISELQWWNTEDEIRNWVHEAECEEELKEITFSEHKVNGKSKGQAYVELASSQAATATKRHIDSLFGSDTSGSGHGQQRHPNVSYHAQGNNPFKTLPKDAPQRARENAGRGAPGGPGNFNNNIGQANSFQASGSGGFQGGFRGGRGGYNRGGMRGGFNANYGNSNMGAFNNNMGAFNNPMGGGFGGPGFNRGGGMGRGTPGMGGPMRGGRGGMMGNPGGMPMGMGGMPMGMGAMPPMGMNMMGPMGGFNNMPGQYTQPFFGGGNQGGFGGQAGGGGGGGAEWGNPHGTKRPRGE